MKTITYLLSILWLVFATCCTDGPASQPRNELTRGDSSTIRSGNEAPIMPLGSFSNMIADGGHSSGFTIMLWAKGTALNGLIFGGRALRLTGDPPAGLLEEIAYDSRSGKLAFKARLSTGKVASSDDKGWVWTKDLYIFDGYLSSEKISGTLRLTDELCPDKCPKDLKIELVRSFDESSRMQVFSNNSSWDGFVNELLERSGPRW